MRKMGWRASDTREISFEDCLREVSEARICDGVHYRNSTEVGTAMGRKVGAWVAAEFSKP